MSQDYYIVTHKGDAGPYDIVMLIKKIRNGSLTPATLLKLENDGSAKPAQEWALLSEFFMEITEEKTDSVAHVHYSGGGLVASLQNGWRFLQHNQLSTLFSGMVVLAIVSVLGISIFILPPSMRVVAYIVCLVMGHFLVSCYMLVVLRMTRGQPVDGIYIQQKLSPVIGSLLISSMLISFVPVVGLAFLTGSALLPVKLLGLFIFTVPGLFLLALYSFAPLLILDQQYDFWEAMEASRKMAMKIGGMEIAGINYALFVINFIAGLFVLLPMAITLPMTLGAICEVYDEVFS